MVEKLSISSLECFVLLSFLAFAVSCSSPGSKEESTVASADTTVPTVTTISPADGTTNMAVTSTISITFNKSIEPRNVTASTSENCNGTMQLSVDGFNSCIPAVVSYDSSRKIYTLTAGSSSSALELVSSTKHQLKVTTSVKDYFSIALDSDYISEGFTTTSICTSGCAWSDIAATGLTAGSGHAVVFYLGKLWVIGGGNGSSVYSKVFSSSDGITWKDAGASDDLSGRNDHAATAFNGKLWVMGGGSNGSSLLNDVLSSTDGKTWTSVSSAAAWTPRHKHSLLVFNNKMYLLGGIDNSSAKMNDVWSTSDGKTWTEITDNATWSKRSGHAATVFNQKIWVMGGDNGSTLSDVWYSSTDNASTWTQATTSGSTWLARSGHTATVYEGKLWVIGGNADTESLNVWSSTDGSVWTNVGAKSGETSRSGIESGVMANRLYLIGGYTGSVYKDDVQKYGP